MCTVAGTDWLANLGQTQRKSRISDKALALVAHEIGDIIHVGKVMGFTKAKIEQYQGSCPYSVSNQISRMFSDWRAKMASNATVEKFVGLMQDAEVDGNMVMEVIMREYSDGVVNGVLHLH